MGIQNAKKGAFQANFDILFFGPNRRSQKQPQKVGKKVRNGQVPGRGKILQQVAKANPAAGQKPPVQKQRRPTVNKASISVPRAKEKGVTTVADGKPAGCWTSTAVPMAEAEAEAVHVGLRAMDGEVVALRVWEAVGEALAVQVAEPASVEVQVADREPVEVAVAEGVARWLTVWVAVPDGLAVLVWEALEVWDGLAVQDGLRDGVGDGVAVAWEVGLGEPVVEAEREGLWEVVGCRLGLLVGVLLGVVLTLLVGDVVGDGVWPAICMAYIWWLAGGEWGIVKKNMTSALCCEGTRKAWPEWSSPVNRHLAPLNCG